MGNRKDHRNGIYLRRQLTTMGLVEVAVPRTRQCGSALEAIGRYKRRASELADAIIAAHVEGVSTRDMSRMTEALMGEGVSRSTVSRVTKQLDEGSKRCARRPSWI